MKQSIFISVCYDMFGNNKEFLNDLNIIDAILKSSDNLFKILKDPSINPQIKLNILENIIKKIKEQNNLLSEISKEVKSLLFFLAQKDKLVFLYELKQKLEEKQKEKENILSVKVFSVKKLNKEQESIIRSIFNNKIEIETFIEESLIGGFRIETKDYIIDNSIVNRLRTFQKKLLS